MRNRYSHPFFFSFRKICLLSPRALATFLWLLPLMEAKLRRCPFEWVNVTIEYEQPLRSQRSLLSFTRYSSLLAFVCFGTSSVAQRLVTISSNCFEFYTKYQHVITLFFGATYCLSRDVLQKTTNISQSFQKGAWTKQALPSRNVLKGVIGASWKFRGNFFCKEGILPFESDVIFFSSNGDSIIDDKHLRIISQRRLRHAIEKRLFPCRNIEVSLIWTSWKLWRKFWLMRKAIISTFQSATNSQKNR